MNVQDNELNSAQIAASNEANAASAAREDSEKDDSEEDSLIDYNNVDDDDTAAELAAKAERKAADQKALREMLANQGFAMSPDAGSNRA